MTARSTVQCSTSPRNWKTTGVLVAAARRPPPPTWTSSTSTSRTSTSTSASQTSASPPASASDCMTGTCIVSTSRFMATRHHDNKCSVERCADNWLWHGAIPARAPVFNVIAMSNIYNMRLYNRLLTAVTLGGAHHGGAYDWADTRRVLSVSRRWSGALQ